MPGTNHAISPEPHSLLLCSVSMLTNAAGLFACGTAFDKGVRAIFINLVSFVRPPWLQ